jgi:aminoglycoside phosphotransferase (APT) family kinase protein
LVHGDYSPKNILIGQERMVILDCEVAWYGDPAFDLAFLLNHLCLKALHHAPGGAGLRALIDAARRSYRQSLSDQDWRRRIEERVARLLPMLMLARVDGKSPVEYLAEDRRRFVRHFVSRRLLGSARDLDRVVHDWFAGLRRVGQGSG